MSTIPKTIFEFLKDLKENNHRDWMTENKKQYQSNEKILKAFYASVAERLNEKDEIEKTKVFRINRDVRFSKNKTPYNVHRSASFSRAGAHRRGGYYLRLEPGNSLMAGGFFSPEPADLLRVRKEFEMDDQEIREILSNADFKKAFNGFDSSNQVKTAPKGFSKDHPNIDLIKNKSFFVAHNFTDDEVFAPDFLDKVVYHYELLRPFFDYMSDVLTTDLNGVSLID
ncbi:uncharacterized protein (TIGR02453 family) [Aquimarina sp. EL_43]|uniref:DUF2461 domain-containing protein n=1 Tax=Aquimarina TaxID=290174 RepID=UPI00046FE26F|nr:MULTISPECIES: DUF2461 domain-containing protein [Aquimarina]MBG6129865.1 uncharacterized protein (TIGR02453 family) [Aquimarina sp. EL_35]MBG6150930.1 uncharacterized protein (TIGR02453 family) [Aquimarina sp. EL_32]MBG6167763.1 uncharacterized protein (TIGR02453 family) [Aquimarina sp. EL_43]